MEELKIYDGRAVFWQWDLDQKLIVPDGLGNEVHFSNFKYDKTPVCEVYEMDGVRLVYVPNIMLQDDLPLTVYAYTSDDKGERTTYAQAFKVIARPKPDDYVYTETEVRTWEDLDERIKALENSGGPEVDPEYVGELVEGYLEKNPPASGKDGKDGVTPEFSIGEVETLPAGSEATATITGTKENPVLNLGIPKGDKGDDGTGGSADIPSALPNPHKLTFTGAVNAEYDGSKEVEVNIPAGGGGGAEWKLLFATEEAIDKAGVLIDADPNGLPLSCKEILIVLKGVATGDNSDRNIFLNGKNDAKVYWSNFPSTGSTKNTGYMLIQATGDGLAIVHGVSGFGIVGKCSSAISLGDSAITSVLYRGNGVQETTGGGTVRIYGR